jgi:hypothetical protein
VPERFESGEALLKLFGEIKECGGWKERANTYVEFEDSLSITSDPSSTTGLDIAGIMASESIVRTIFGISISGI